MTTTDYILNGLLVSLVVLQIRGRRLTVRSLLLPIAVVAYIASQYLHGIPTAGNDLGLVFAGAGAGLVLGTGCGLATSVSRDQHGALVSKAGFLAAFLWVAGVGARLGFSVYSQNGGAPAIGRFMVAHHVTGVEAWVACFVLMGAMEVAGRTSVLAWRMFSQSRAGAKNRLASPLPAAARSMIDLDGSWS